MYDNGFPEREPQLDVINMLSRRVRAIADSVANVEQGVPLTDTPQSVEGGQVIDMQKHFNSSYAPPENTQGAQIIEASHRFGGGSPNTPEEYSLADAG